MARTFVAASSQRIDFGDINALDGLATLTVSMWVKPTTLVDFQQLIAKDATGSVGWAMHPSGTARGNNDDCLIAIRNGSNTFGHTTSNLLVAGTWGHWCGVYDGAGTGDAGRLRFYFNGIERPLTYVGGSVPATFGSNAAPVLLGYATHALDPYFNGTIAEVAIWNAPLSIPEIAELARGRRPLRIRLDNLAAYWPLFGNNFAEPDLSPKRGTSGIVTGAILATHPPAVPLPHLSAAVKRVYTPSEAISPSSGFGRISQPITTGFAA